MKLEIAHTQGRLVGRTSCIDWQGKRGRTERHRDQRPIRIGQVSRAEIV